MRACTWCGRSDIEITDDHVIPQCLGGTKELVLPSCKKCQNEISKAEGELIHKSPFSLWRADSGPGPRKKKDPRSGRIELRYMFRPDPHLGGRAESTMRATGERRDLTSFELNLETKQARKRAKTPQEFDLLISKFKALFAGGPDDNGVVGQIRVDLLTEYDQNIAEDPDFWPRVFLGVDGHPRVRARNPAEATQLTGALMYLIQAEAFSRARELETFTVPGGTCDT
jgi:hypothetical protein